MACPSSSPATISTPFTGTDYPPTLDPLVHRCDEFARSPSGRGSPERPPRAQAHVIAGLALRWKPSSALVKILLSSYVFSPSVGGIETVSALLAPEFVKAGHEVILITKTGTKDKVERPYRGLTQAQPVAADRAGALVRRLFPEQHQPAPGWPLFFVRRPWVIAHHTWLRPYPGKRIWMARLKRHLLKYGTNATISRAVAGDFPCPRPSWAIPTIATVFTMRPEIPRDRELVYLGRLVSDKGVDIASRMRWCSCRSAIFIRG